MANDAIAQGDGSLATGALDGLRVVDLTWVIMGPSVTQYLAKAGAEVIKIESRTRLDALRVTPPLGGTGVDASFSFNQYNACKESITLDLSRDVARRLALELVSVADVVVENFTGGTLEKLGLGYDTLRRVRPEIILLSLSSFGHRGSWGRMPGFGMGLAALAGFTNLSGWPDRPPITPAAAYTDFVVPPLAVTTLLAALWERERTGRGQWIDFAQCSAAELYLAAPLLEAAVNGRDWERMGNRSHWAAPHGVYPTNQPDIWCAIAVENDAQWAALVTAMGSPEWAADERYASAEGRLAAADELDQRLVAWTSAGEIARIVSSLEAAGVPAAPVRGIEEVMADPQLAHRGLLATATHPQLGEVVDLMNGYRLSRNATRAGRAPMLGEHSGVVLQELLGLSDDVIAGLYGEGVME